MRHYPIGKIQETKKDFAVKLFKGKIEEEFVSQAEAAAFAVSSVQNFVDKQNITASLKHERLNGIVTYMMFDAKKPPYEISQFEFQRTHSPYFPKGSLRSVIDEKNIKYSSIARVNASGTVAQTRWSWARIFTSTAILTTVAVFVFYFLLHTTDAQEATSIALDGHAINNGPMLWVMGTICALLGVSLALTIGVKAWYKKLTGRRKNRTLEKIREIQLKNWGKFNKYVKMLQWFNLFIIVAEIILTFALIVMFSQTFYFQRLNLYWESMVILITTITYFAYLTVVGLGIFLYGFTTTARQRQALIDTYLPEGHKPYYKAYILIDDVIDEKFPSTRKHYILPDAPKHVKESASKHVEKSRVSAMKLAAEQKAISKAAVNKHFEAKQVQDIS